MHTHQSVIKIPKFHIMYYMYRVFTWFIYKYVNIEIYTYISYIHINCQYQLNHIIIISLESYHLPFPPPSPTLVFQKNLPLCACLLPLHPKTHPNSTQRDHPQLPRSFSETHAVPRERLLVTGDQSSLSRTSAKRTRESTFCPPEPRLRRKWPRLRLRNSEVREKREHQSNPGIPDGCCCRFMK